MSRRRMLRRILLLAGSLLMVAVPLYAIGPTMAVEVEPSQADVQ